MDAFIRRIPKTDLHVHLDGSVRIPTLIDICKSRGVKLPSYSEDGLLDLVFKQRYKDLPDYLQGFAYTIAAMQDAESLERIAYEFAQDNIEEGVRYVEVRFAPQFHVNEQLSIDGVLSAVDAGLKRCAYEFNERPEIKSGEEPPFHYGIIVCAMRAFSEGLSKYFDNFMFSHKYSSPTRIFALASMELVQAAVKIKREMGLPIVGFDLAGAEAGFPAQDHRDAYDYAHKHFLKKTVHAGEAYGPESIFQAITDLYADRIGHGYHLFDKNLIKDKDIDDPGRYVSELAQYIADRRVTIEICLTSNMQTKPYLKNMGDHEFKNMLKSKLSTTICTDNRTVSRTTISNEIKLALQHFPISQRELKNIIIYGFKRSFFSGTYLEKREYVRRIIDFYDKVETEMQPNYDKPKSGKG